MPGSAVEHSQGAYNLPHIALVKSEDANVVEISALGTTSVVIQTAKMTNSGNKAAQVQFTIEIDRKGNAAYDKAFISGWPRASQKAGSERHLANIDGTFYEITLVTNGEPPAWNLMRPVWSHSKQITDFSSWNGLLVLSANERHGLAATFSR